MIFYASWLCGAGWLQLLMIGPWPVLPVSPFPVSPTM